MGSIEAKIEASRRKQEEIKTKKARENKVSSEEDYISKNSTKLLGTLRLDAEEIE